MAERWYYVCEAAELEAVRQVLPVAPGAPRVSHAGDLAMVKLTHHVEGAISHGQAARTTAKPAWRVDEDPEDM